MLTIDEIKEMRALAREDKLSRLGIAELADQAILAISLQDRLNAERLWKELTPENIRMDDLEEYEGDLLCRFADNEIETFPLRELEDWNNRHPYQKATHYQLLPEFQIGEQK